MHDPIHLDDRGRSPREQPVGDRGRNDPLARQRRLSLGVPDRLGPTGALEHLNGDEAKHCHGRRPGHCKLGHR
jgi:hypothetical protein